MGSDEYGARDSYVATWQKFRIGNWLWLTAWLTTVPVLLPAIVYDAKTVAWTWIATAVPAFLSGGFVRLFTSCPRYHRPFVGLLWPAFPTHCRHCGLPFGAERDPDGGGD